MGRSGTRTDAPAGLPQPPLSRRRSAPRARRRCAHTVPHLPPGALTMRAYLPFVIIGLTTGAVYALAALGLVLTYRTSGVFNFGHGAIGMFATYLFYSQRQHLPTALAAALAILVLAPLMGVLIDRLLLRRLQGALPATYIAASLGLLVALQGIATGIYGAATRRIDPIFPTGTYRAFDINLG